MTRMLQVAIIILSATVMTCEASDTDLEAVKAEMLTKLANLGCVNPAIIKIEKANPAKNLLDQYNPRSVYCFTYRYEEHMDNGKAFLNTHSQIGIVAKSGAVHIMSCYDLMNNLKDVEKLELPDREKRCTRVWDSNCPYVSIEDCKRLK